MLVLGLLLVLLAIALIVGAIYDGAEPATMEAFGAELDTTVAGVFFTGVGTTLLLFIGLAILKSATTRSRRVRAERKAQRARQRESFARLEQERNELRAENERLAKQAAAAPAGAGTAQTSGVRGDDSGAARTDQPRQPVAAPARTDIAPPAPTEQRAPEQPRPVPQPAPAPAPGQPAPPSVPTPPQAPQAYGQAQTPGPHPYGQPPQGPQTTSPLDLRPMGKHAHTPTAADWASQRSGEDWRSHAPRQG